MKPSELSILLSEGEGSMLEYKESLSSSFARELVALANTAGGKMLLGVRDDGTVKGIADSNTLRARIQDIARNCDPPVKVLVEPVGKVMVVTVRESDAKPVQCSDGFFWRQGAVTQKLTRNEIRDFFRNEGVIRFDLSPCPRFRYPQDFDRKKYDTWLHLSGISGRPRTEDVLVNVEAAERSGGRLVFRNAGVLFFARDARRFFNQAYVTCLLFKGTDKVHVLDRKDFAGGVVSDIEDSLRFIERNTRTAYRIEGLRREEIPEYPAAALRETVTNAVMHRDWFNEGANVFVEIYADRIEVSNPGGLPSGMLPSDLGRKSVRRNPLIADLLHRIEYIEKAGTGIRRMREAVKAHGSPPPVFESTGFFTAIFRPLSVRTPEATGEVAGEATGEVAGQVTGEGATPQVTPQVTPKVTPQVRLPRTPEVTPEVTGEDATPQVTPQVRLLRAMDGEMSRQALQSAMGLQDVKHFRRIYLLPTLELGFIEMTIPNRPRSSKQRYRITPLGLAALRKTERAENNDD